MNDVTTKAPRLTEAQKRSVACPTCSAGAGKACRSSRIPGANTLGGGWGGPPDLDRAHDARRQAALRTLTQDRLVAVGRALLHGLPDPALPDPVTDQPPAPAPKPRKVKPQTVTVRETGEVLTLAPRVPTGEIPCPGEAHKNAFIDHCGICAPRWGTVMGYAAPTVADCLNGFAVPCGLVGFDRETRAPFEEAEKAGTIKIVAVETKNSSFNVYVATSCMKHTDCKETLELGQACREATKAVGS